MVQLPIDKKKNIVGINSINSINSSDVINLDKVIKLNAVVETKQSGNLSSKKVHSKKSNSRREKIFKQRKNSFQEVAKNRILELFIQAEKMFNEDENLSKRYVFLAKNISMKYKVPFSKDQKLRSCKACGAFLKQGTNARIRLSKGNLVIKCLVCNNIRRFKHK